MFRGPASAIRRAALVIAIASCAAGSAVIKDSAPRVFAQSPQIIDVPAGGNLQQALTAAQPGATIRLTPGATYVGTFTLPAKNGSSFITITTRDAQLPPAGTRINPSYKPGLAVIRSPTTISALTTAAGASYYRIVGVAFEANQNGAGDVITLGGASATSVAQLPHHIELDRVLIAGDPTVGQKRGVSVNATHVSITNSDIRDIKAVGQDSQAICGWNTPGPIVIRNNYLEAAGENIMFGGAGVSIPGVVPSDIVIETNLLTKDLAWRGQSWTVKNLFELKHARRVVVRRNIMTNNWAGAQQGFAIVFTPRNSGGQPTSWVVEDVEFSGNIVSHSSSGFNLLGYDDLAPSGQLARVLIKDNLLYDIGMQWGGTGTFAQIGGEPRDITIDHNTVMHEGNAVTFYSGNYTNPNGVRVTGGPIAGFVFTNNLLKHNAYGIFGSGQAFGSGTINYYTTGGIVLANVLASDTSYAYRYPAGNQFPALAVFTSAFANVFAHDYRLRTGSPYLAAGTDARDLGCDFATLLALNPPMPPSRARVTEIVR
jgi:hypothetical protein